MCCVELRCYVREQGVAKNHVVAVSENLRDVLSITCKAQTCTRHEVSSLLDNSSLPNGFQGLSPMPFTNLHAFVDDRNKLNYFTAE